MFKNPFSFSTNIKSTDNLEPSYANQTCKNQLYSPKSTHILFLENTQNTVTNLRPAIPVNRIMKSVKFLYHTKYESLVKRYGKKGYYNNYLDDSKYLFKQLI